MNNLPSFNSDTDEMTSGVDTANAASNLPGDTTLPTSEAELNALIALDKGGNYSVEDLFKNPERSSFDLSPEGDFISYLAPYEKRMNIHVQARGQSEAVRITSETERDVAGYMWANSTRIVFLKDDGGDENFKLYAVNTDGTDPLDLTPFEDVKIELIDDLEDDEQHVIVGMNKENKMLFEPYRLNVLNGELTKLATNADPLNPVVRWVTDHNGNLLIKEQMTDGTDSSIWYRSSENDEFKLSIRTNFKEGIQPLFYDFKEPNVIYALSNLNRDKNAVVRFDLEKGEELELLFEHPDVDAGGLSYSRKRKVLTHITYTTDKRHYELLDEERFLIQQFLEEQLPGKEIVLAGRDKHETKYLVRTYSDRSLGAYYFYDREKNELELLSEVSPWLDESQMAPMQPVSFKSRDGLILNGYLTLPVGEFEGPIPLVINPHGGPWHRDVWGYNPEAQLLAGKGYAVMQVNFRGSTGYGRKFWEASFGQWGLKMQDDITDAVNRLVEQGIADPDKIAIYGGSYGGYATLAGVTYTPDLYCCACDFVGVSNLFTFVETFPPYWKPFLEMMHEMLGHPEKDKERLEATSPALNTEKIKTPLLIVQGANDPRVNIDESDQVVRALRKRGVDVPYLVKYDEGHGFRNEENKIYFYKVLVGFFAQYLG